MLVLVSLSDILDSQESSELWRMQKPIYFGKSLFWITWIIRGPLQDDSSWGCKSMGHKIVANVGLWVARWLRTRNAMPTRPPSLSPLSTLHQQGKKIYWMLMIQSLERVVSTSVNNGRQKKKKTSIAVV